MLRKIIILTALVLISFVCALLALRSVSEPTLPEGQVTLHGDLVPSFAPTQVAHRDRHDEPAQETYQLPERHKLPGQSVLIGRVVLPDGHSIGRNVLVYAWPRSYPLAPERLGSDRAVLTTTSDLAGRFQIEGVDNSITYSLVAGVPGWVSPSVRTARAPTHDIRIELWRVLGAVVETVDDTGRLVREARERARRELTVRESRARFLPVQSVLGAAAGLQYYVRAVGEQDWRRCLIAYVSPKYKSPRSELSIGYRIYGYEPALARIRLEPFGGPIPIIRVALASRTSDWGRITVHIQSSLVFDRRPDMDGHAPARVEFVQHVEDRTFEFPIKDLRTGTVEIDDVPAGVYRAFMTTEWEWRKDLGRVEVRAGSTALLRADVPELGGIEVGIDEVNANARARFEVVSAGQQVIYGFARPPYIIQGIPLGEYQISVLYVEGEELRADYRATSTARTGTVVSISLRRKGT